MNLIKELRMTRKDYQLIASVLKNFVGDMGDVIDRDAMALELAKALGADNPRFDRDKFLLAAGYINQCDQCDKASRYSTNAGSYCVDHLPEWAKRLKSDLLPSA
jgi:hypothetical protein